MAKEQKKTGSKGKVQGLKVRVKKQTIKDLEPRAGRDVKGGTGSFQYRRPK